MELNHRFLFVRQKSLPLDNGTLRVDSLGVAPRSQACGACVFLLDHEPFKAEAVGLEPTSRWCDRLFSSCVSATAAQPSSSLPVGGGPCFRPDDFRRKLRELE